MTAKKFTRGLVLGKFMPPHHGHRLVIQTALAQSAQVTLVISVLPTDSIPADRRATWLHQLYPSATVVIMPVTWPVTDAQAWAVGALAALGGQRPDAVFSSEDYGQQLADLWGCTHVMVDQERNQVPVSSQKILANLKDFQQYLDPVVWDELARFGCVL